MKLHSFSNRKRRRNFKAVLLKIFLLFLLGLLLFYLGIKIVINLLFISSKLLPDKSTSPEKKQEEFKLPIELILYDYPEATNESSISLNISVSNADKLQIYLNDELFKEIKNPASNEKIILDNLKEGENLIYAVAENSATKLSQKSKTIKVIVDNTAPELEISEPQDGYTTVQDFVEIKGQTENGVILKINNTPVIVMSDGSFSYRYFLKEGENQIQISAEDQAGNITEKELKVIKESP